MRFSEGRSGLCWDDCGGNYLLLGSVISGEVGSDEMKCEGAFLNSWYWPLVCNIFSGGGLFCVDTILGLVRPFALRVCCITRSWNLSLTDSLYWSCL